MRCALRLLPARGANLQTYTATFDGDYSVLVTDTNGCMDTSATFLVDLFGIEELKAQGINFYPNPSAGIININVKNFSNEAVKVNVIDEVERIAFSEIVIGQKEINIRSLARGVYYLQFISDEKTLVGKVMKR